MAKETNPAPKKKAPEQKQQNSYKPVFAGYVTVPKLGRIKVFCKKGEKPSAAIERVRKSHTK